MWSDPMQNGYLILHVFPVVSSCGSGCIWADSPVHEKQRKQSGEVEWGKKGCPWSKWPPLWQPDHLHPAHPSQHRACELCDTVPIADPAAELPYTTLTPRVARSQSGSLLKWWSSQLAACSHMFMLYTHFKWGLGCLKIVWLTDLSDWCLKTNP